jgi:hypothetical protein
MPPRYEVVKGERVETEWHPEATKAWAEWWQFPLVYQAPEVDHHLLVIYLGLVDNYWHKLEAGKAITEQAAQIRSFSEQWGIGEKSRRHLQITIQEAEEAIERGARMQPKRVEAQEPTAALYTPNWTEDDEDDGSIIDADVVS